jgi:hypothetical protein
VRDPRDITRITNQVVIRSTFELNAYIPGAAGTKFNVHFNPAAYPHLYGELGLEQDYEVLGHNVSVFRDAEAVYAKPEHTEVTDCNPTHVEAS